MGLFSSLKKKAPELGPQTMIPKLVIGINQVDNLGPWDNVINQPTDATEKIILTRANDVIKKLNLTNIVAIHGRCEDFAKKPEFREKFDYCVARAVAKLNTLAEYCLPFVKLYGYMIAYKSRNAQQEIEEATNALSTLGGKLMNIKVVDIFEIEAERNFLFIQKKFKTPLQYPRFQNKPKTNPL